MFAHTCSAPGPVVGTGGPISLTGLERGAGKEKLQCEHSMTAALREAARHKGHRAVTLLGWFLPDKACSRYIAWGEIAVKEGRPQELVISTGALGISKMRVG